MNANNAPLINRELSWLEFNARVLQEAADSSNPLIERVKFLGIYSNNLDEFFRVRVATLNRMADLINRKELGISVKNPRSVLKQIGKIIKDQQKQFASIYHSLLTEMQKCGIYLLNEKELNEEQGLFVRKVFHDKVRAKLFPIMLDFLKLNTLADKRIYLLVKLSCTDNPNNIKHAVIQIPVKPLSRFIQLPSPQGTYCLILLEDVIRFCLNDVFAIFGYDSFEAYTFKFTRDAEMDIDNDVSKSFLEIMSESLKQRKKAAAVRLVYDRKMPKNMLRLLKEKMEVTDNDTIVEGGRYHNFKDFMAFPELGPASLHYDPMPPLPHPRLPANTSIFELVKRNEIMLHTPYQSFNYIIDLLREASIDPSVRSIKMTLYRLASDSDIINALINAARNGKQVTVFMELQARFNEEANIQYAEKLHDERVRLIQGTPGFKVHSKLLLIRRKENQKNVYYANISTGNYNEKTATLYADDSLLTADQSITTEINSVFHLFESKYNPPKFKKLVVSLFGMRQHFIRLLNNEIRHAQQGLDAWCIIKLNNLMDEKLSRKLYQASQAGVKIDIICRGSCAVVPGIPGVSDNIRVISIVDRFLEHSRVFVFANAGDELYYISSADWMVRNLDARIEVACPIYDKEIRHQLKTMLLLQLKDNTKARYVNNNLPNAYVTGAPPVIRSQAEIYRFFK